MFAEYWPVSSKTQENIQKLFFRVAALAFDKCIIRTKEKSDIIIESDLICKYRHTAIFFQNNFTNCIVF